MQYFDVYETLALIRPRPAVYIGQHSLNRLDAFLVGCHHMAHVHGMECTGRPDFHGFHDWIAKKFGWRESTAGWRHIILQECNGHDGNALDRFFELVDEFKNQ